MKNYSVNIIFGRIVGPLHFVIIINLNNLIVENLISL